MKRSHRRGHRRLWPILVACTAAAVVLALIQRPDEAKQPEWPPVLATPSR